MALFSSQLLTAASGSVGGLTFLPSRGGMALRAKATPVNPSTPLQNTIRAIAARVATEWTGLLSVTQREGWERHAAGNLRRNALGRLINIGGLAMWIRCQVPRRYAGIRLQRTPPTDFTDAPFTPVVPLTVASIGQALILAFDNKDAWANTIHAAMLVFIAPPVNPTINRYRGSYRLAFPIPGNPFFPPLSPAAIPLPFPVVIGQRVFFRVAVTSTDARYSTGQVAHATVT